MKKFLTLSIVVAMLGLTGCSKTEAPTAPQTTEATSNATPSVSQDSTPPPQKAEPFVSKLPPDAPIVKAAVTGTDEPFSFRDDYGNVQGIEVDVMRAIGETEGFRVQFNEIPRKQLLDDLEAGKFDVGVAFFGRSPERAEKYNLTDSYFYAPNVVGYRNKNLKIGSIDDLGGLRVGTIDGSVHHKDLLERKDVKEVIGMPSSFLLYTGLLQDKYDAIIEDATALRYALNTLDETDIILAPYKENEVRADNEAVMLVNKNNTKLTKQINEGIAKLRQDGTLEKIEKKWLGDLK